MSVDSLHSGGVGGPQPNEGPQDKPKISGKLAKLTGSLSDTSGVDPSKVKAEYIERRGGAHRLGGAGGLFAKLMGKTEHVRFAESKDVRTLPPETFQQAERTVRKYGVVSLAANAMLLFGANDTYDRWVTLSSTFDYGSPSVSEDKANKLVLTPSVHTSAEALKKTLGECGFEPCKTGFIHKKTGMQLALLYYQDDKEITLFFRGLGDATEKGFFARFGQVVKDSLGLRAQSTDVCITLGKKLAELQGTKITVSGHSHGGNLAQIVAMTAGLPAVCFNSRAVSRDAQEAIKETIGDNYGKNARAITHFNKQGCWVTDNPALSAITKFIAKAKGQEPAQRLGTQYYVPSNEKGTFACHNDVSWPEGLQADAWDTKNEDNLIY